ncbi:hypothetical protein DFH06DRAFT_1351889 [Mycena polygramma]|nr:hypothetical protein DFH06DRAFT_1351889 [Mycena polygramma]
MSTPAGSPTSLPQRPHIVGIHHLKLPTSALPAKLEFYTSILPLTYLPHLDHRHADSGELFGVILQQPQTALLVELWLQPAQRRWDAVTWSVETHADLESCRVWFVECEVPCSRILRGFLAWVLVAEDPDGAMVRWYCNETHEWDPKVDVGK